MLNLLYKNFFFIKTEIKLIVNFLLFFDTNVFWRIGNWDMLFFFLPCCSFLHVNLPFHIENRTYELSKILFRRWKNAATCPFLWPTASQPIQKHRMTMLNLVTRIYISAPHYSLSLGTWSCILLRFICYSKIYWFIFITSFTKQEMLDNSQQTQFWETEVSDVGATGHAVPNVSYHIPKFEN
jgi:hypothetical protein